MGKGRIFGSIALGLCIAAAAAWMACGNSNDQGISFRALGFFEDGAGTRGDAGTCANLGEDVNVPQGSGDRSQSNPGGGGFLGLENNMNQGLLLDHVDLSYHINGASLAVPNDVYALSGRLGPASGQEANGPREFVQIRIVAPNIFKFLNDNRSRLPDLPFSMVVVATAVATADSGDVFRTNRINYEVRFDGGQIQCSASPTPQPTTATAP